MRQSSSSTLVKSNVDQLEGFNFKDSDPVKRMAVKCSSLRYLSSSSFFFSSCFITSNSSSGTD